MTIKRKKYPRERKVGMQDKNKKIQACFSPIYSLHFLPHLPPPPSRAHRQVRHVKKKLLLENLGGLKQEVGDDIRKISSTNWKRSQCCRGWHFSRRPAEAECLDSSVLSAQAHTPRQLHFFFPDDKSSSAGDKSCHCLRVHHGFNLTTT